MTDTKSAELLAVLLNLSEENKKKALYFMLALKASEEV